MKKLLIALILLLVAATAGYSQVPLRITEVDGAPSKVMPSRLVFPNGTLAVAGGTVTFTPAVAATMATTDAANTFTAVQTIRVADALAAAVTDTLVLFHRETGGPSAGFGAGLLFRLTNDDGGSTSEEAVRVSAVWSDSSAASEDSDLVVSLRTAGAAIAERFRIKSNGLLVLPQTVTAAGTTGNQTINLIAGTVNIAAAGTAVTVTNSLCTTSSTVHAMTRTNDSACSVKNVVPGAGSFVVTMTAGCNAETSIGFLVVN